jgi:1-phosphofructokinase family hexose kinase
MRYFTLTLHPSIDRVLEVDRMEPGKVLNARVRMRVPAGKGVNTARVLTRLLPQSSRKDNVYALAWLGSGEKEFVTQYLRKEKIFPEICPRECQTRICTTVVEVGGKETHLKEAMPAPDDAEQRALLSFTLELPWAGAAAALCGSAPAGTPEGFLEKWVAAIRSKGELLIADTNGPLLEIAGRAGWDGIKGNAEEIGQWLELDGPFRAEKAAHRKDLIERLRPYSPKNPRQIMITLGPEGALLAADGKIWRVEPPSAPAEYKNAITSTVGCGDAATAGWLLSWNQKLAPKDCVSWAVACGTAKLYEADPGAVNIKLVKDLVARCKPKSLG